jgi:KUP system potassium uptake protein
MAAEKAVEMEEGADDQTTEIVERKLKERKISWAKLRRVDSLNLEAGRLSLSQSHASKVAFRSYNLINYNLIINSQKLA